MKELKEAATGGQPGAGAGTGDQRGPTGSPSSTPTKRKEQIMSNKVKVCLDAARGQQVQPEPGGQDLL